MPRNSNLLKGKSRALPSITTAGSAVLRVKKKKGCKSDRWAVKLSVCKLVAGLDIQYANWCYRTGFPLRRSVRAVSPLTREIFQNCKSYNRVVGHQQRSLTRLSHLFNISTEIIMGIAVDGYHSGIKVGRRRWCNLKRADDTLAAESVVSALRKLVPSTRDDLGTHNGSWKAEYLSSGANWEWARKASEEWCYA